MNIGIDFGTTYSTVAFMKGNELKEYVPADKSASIPSVVTVQNTPVGPQFYCGFKAKESIGNGANAHVFQAFKLLLTETSPEKLRKYDYDDHYMPRDIASRFLKNMLRGVWNDQHADKFENVYICVPENWQQEVTKRDARSILHDILHSFSDMTVEHVHIVSEPEAASAFYAYEYERETGKKFNGHLLLIDYGGGTLDLTITEVESSSKGNLEIRYIDSGGDGDNHISDDEDLKLGAAGVAFMQNVVERVLHSDDYKSPEFVRAFKHLESSLTDADKIKEIQDFFMGIVGGSNYKKIVSIMKNNPKKFEETFDYFGKADGTWIMITYGDLVQSYMEVIEPVLQKELQKINQKIIKKIKIDPCRPEAGAADNFKIALVGGFSTFYLVKAQIADVYSFASDVESDLRVKNISVDKQKHAVADGAALLASEKVILKRTARFSIGLLYKDNKANKQYVYYGITYHQPINPGQVYKCSKHKKKQTGEYEKLYPVPLTALNGNIDFVKSNNENLIRGIPMNLKENIREKIENALPKDNDSFYCGFSMDKSEIITFSVIRCSDETQRVDIKLTNSQDMFDLTEVREVGDE